jgi:hypothetical protein
VGQAAVTASTGRRLPAASRGTASDVVAVLSAGLMLALTAAAVAVMVMVAAGQTSFANLWGTVVLALGCAAVGFAVARRQPANPIGWLLLGFAVIDLVGGFTSGYALLCYRLGHSGLPLGRAAVVAEALSGTLTTVILPLVVLLFPDGRLPSRRWRWAIGVFIVLAGVVLAGQFARAMSAVIGHPVHVDSSGSLVALNNPPRGPWEMALNGLAISAYLLVWLMAAGRQVVGRLAQGGRGAAPAAQVADERGMPGRNRAGGHHHRGLTAQRGKLRHREHLRWRNRHSDRGAAHIYRSGDPEIPAL